MVSCAPMVGVTNRHWRYLMRLITKRASLWTPMFVARRVALRKRHVAEEMLRFHPDERPPVVQLGGDDPKTVLAAGRRCQEMGFAEVNLNLGCPARNAQAGNHGAMLMRPPHTAAVAVLKALTSELSVPVSAKVRIGVDEHDSYGFFRDFIQSLHEDGGCTSFVVHARRALLSGLPEGYKGG